jgi:hypothetical protein
MEARKIELKIGGFYVIGNYPEAGDQWVETEPFDSNRDGFAQVDHLGLVDKHDLGFWCVAQLQSDGSFLLKELYEPERILSVRADLSQGVIINGSC